MKCEKCNSDHDGSYGSGRFCSSLCARGYSTSKDRDAISQRVRKSLSGRKIKVTEDGKRRQQLALKAARLAKPWDSLKRPGKKSRILHEQNNCCNKCRISEWLGKPITLELEHKDGNKENETRDNLECLCPNCHSQTPTWRRQKSALVV